MTDPDSAPHPGEPGEEYTDYPLADLLAPRPAPPMPPDFRDFWRSSHDELGAPDTEVIAQRGDVRAGRSVRRITFHSSGGGRALAWIVDPVPGAPVRGGLVISHGYGGRTEPDLEVVPPDRAAIFPVAPWLPANPGGLPSAEHVLLGIGDRARYAQRFAVADIWRAASILLAQYPKAEGALDFRGGSFGGGIGVMALAWDGRFRRAVLDVPSFGDYPTRLGRRSTGSCEAVRRHVDRAPEDRATLDYFDAAIAAGLVTIPVLVAAARLDPAVDPRGQFAIYRALAGPKQLVVRSAGHTDLDRELVEEPVVESAKQAFLSAVDISGVLPPVRADV